MLINCDACQKKFTVPDSAITVSGRLLQCGSCGNKWTQFPAKDNPAKDNIVDKIKNVIPTRINRSSSKNKAETSLQKKRKINLYSEEYLKKKHGLDINNPIVKKKLKSSKNKNIRTDFGFYSYLLTITIFIVMFFGILNLSKDIIAINYPYLEPYINYLYEIFGVIRISISNLIN